MVALIRSKLWSLVRFIESQTNGYLSCWSGCNCNKTHEVMALRSIKCWLILQPSACQPWLCTQGCIVASARAVARSTHSVIAQVTWVLKKGQGAVQVARHWGQVSVTVEKSLLHTGGQEAQHDEKSIKRILRNSWRYLLKVSSSSYCELSYWERKITCRGIF